MENVLALSTMRSIGASHCEGEELQLCRSGRRSDVSANTREHKGKIKWLSLEELEKKENTGAIKLQL